MRIFMQSLAESSEAPKYYQLILQEDLLGGWTLIRQWGRMGARGSSRTQQFPDRESAQSALAEVRDQQQTKGFSVMFTQGGNP